ncbi:MAG: MFS transporter [Solirubrobacterales bacterium]
MGEARQSSRDVSLIVGAVGLSSLGDFLLWIPLTLHLREMTDSGFAVAALMICLWGPIVLLAPISGAIVDRFETRRVLIVASLAQAAVAGSLALALDSTAGILALAAALGVGFSVAQPAEFALVPAIAGERELTTVNGYIETARYAGITAGPVLGGVLSGAGGVEVALAVNAATFVVVALAAVALAARRLPGAVDESAPHEHALVGAAVLFRDRTLAIVLGVVFVSLLFMSATIPAEVFFIKEDLGASDAVFGIVFSCWALGMVVGAVGVARKVGLTALAAGAIVAAIVQGVGLGLPTAWLVIWFAGGMWFVGGVGHGVKNVLARTLIQERVPGRLHGRAFAAYNGLRNGSELIALAAGGFLIAAIGARTTVALAGAIPALIGVLGLFFYLRRSGAEPEVPDSGAPAEEGVVEPAPVRAAGAVE